MLAVAFNLGDISALLFHHLQWPRTAPHADRGLQEVIILQYMCVWHWTVLTGSILT